VFAGVIHPARPGRRGLSGARSHPAALAVCFVSLSAGIGAPAARGQDLIGGLPTSIESLETLVCNTTSDQSERWEMPGPMPSEPFIGFNEDAVAGVHGVAPVDYAGHVRTIGGNALRTNLDWRNAEPKRDCWSQEWWARWRDFYAAMINRGIRPVFIIGGAPDWARNPTAAERGCKGFAGCVYPPARGMESEWAEYAREVAWRFPDALIEIWNEPNLSSGWAPKPNPERWAELVTVAYDAIKDVSPQTKVVLGGLMNSRTTKTPAQAVGLREFLSRAYAATPSIKGHFDYLGLHPYTTKTKLGRRSPFVRAFRQMRVIRDRNGDATPILVTEFGFSTATPGIDETRQTVLLDRVHSLLATWPDVAGVLYHRVIEPRDTTDDPREIGYAWLRHGKTPPEPRPVYCHFAARAGNSYGGC
jgi:Cellulase (glycosyl hydrolase family 5)